MTTSFSIDELTQEQKDKIEAATFRRFLSHLDKNKDVQNIDLMILADFCRNCLSKWYVAEAQQMGITVSDEQAKERVYGMPYEQWKIQHQTPATEAQMIAYKARKRAKSDF